MTQEEKTYQELNGKIGSWKGLDRDTKSFIPDHLSRLDVRDHKIIPMKEYLRHEQNDNIEKNDRFWSENGIVLGGAVQEHGFEAIAFYKSFRYRDCFPYQGEWGVFYFEQGLEQVKSLISLSIGCKNPGALALEFLRTHERYHYLVDCLTLTIEHPLQKHLYLPYRAAYRNRGPACVEESLANSCVWEWAKNKQRLYQGVLSFAEDFMTVQPGAYKEFNKHPIDLNAELTSNVVYQNGSTPGNANDLAIWPLAIWATNSIKRRYDSLPEHVIRVANLKSIYPYVLIIPEVKSIQDGETVKKKLEKKGNEWSKAWESTKDKILKNPLAKGLNFKLWEKGNSIWSVRVDDGKRAHLKPIALPNWLAIEIGTHKEMGHG